MGVGGGAAVQAFFIVSGFYMALILNGRYAVEGGTARFYKARLARIFGLYWPVLAIYSLAAIVLLVVSDRGPLTSIFQPGMPNIASIAILSVNLFLVGLDGLLFFTFDGTGIAFSATHADIDPGLFRGMIVQPAWSLSMELVFYAVAPWLCRQRVPILLALLATSLALRVWGASAGLVSDPWSHRFLPFEFAHFLLGICAWHIYERRAQVDVRVLDWVLIAFLAIAFFLYRYGISLRSWDAYFDPMRLAFLAIVTISLPSLFAASRSISWDRKIGELSYPIYLLHMLFVSIVLRLPGLSDKPDLSSGVVIGGTIVGAIIVERVIGSAVERWRARIKCRDSEFFLPQSSSREAPKRG